MTQLNGTLRKMITAWDERTGAVSYTLNLDGEGVLPLNDLVGQRLRVAFSGEIFCIACGRKTRKSFNSGHCYPCLQRLAACDRCIVKPELCHFHLGTCRDEDFARRHCMQRHTVYFARSSGVKVGITRSVQQTHRWMDQGAVESLEVAFVAERRAAGLLEVRIAKQMADRTDWRRMLRNDVTDEPFEPHLERVRALLGHQADAVLATDGVRRCFIYPVAQHPTKVTSCRLDKTPHIEQQLTGIKGQYLIFGNQVVNLRNHGGYRVTVEH